MNKKIIITVAVLLPSFWVAADPVVTAEKEFAYVDTAAGKSSLAEPLVQQISSASKIDEARLLLQEGKAVQAITSLESIERNTDSWELSFLLGTAYLLVGQLDDASNALDYALGLNARVAEIWVQRAAVEQERENAQAALQLLQVALQINPNCAEIYLNAAYAYEHLEKTNAARAAYGQYLKLSAKGKQNGRLRRQVLSRISQIGKE